MPDPIDLNNPPATPPTLPDPQDVVDAALNIEPTATTPAPAPEVATVPETATASEVPEPVAPTPPPTPVAIPEPESISVPMGDEMPLAFVTPLPTTTTTTTTSTTQPVDDAAPLPPVSPVVPMAAEQPKRKSSGLKNVLGVVVGIFLLVMAVGFGGYYTYLNFGGAEIPTISYITKFTRNSEGKTILNPDYVKQDPINKAINEEEREKDLGINQPVSQVPAEKAGCGSAGCCGDGYEYCGGAINKCVSYGALSGAGGGCNKYGEVVYNIPTVYGSNYTTDPNKAGFTKQCSCYGTTYYFDKTGYCGGGDTTDPSGLSNQTLQTGLCAITPSAPIDGIADKINAGQKGVPIYYYCPNVTEETFAGCQTLGKPKDSSCFCGTTQVDTPGKGFESKTMKCGCDKDEKTTVDAATTTTTTTDSPTMACTGLTRVPTTTPVVGQAVTFSCAGSVTPSSAGTLSYKYRYSLNSGSYLPMTSNVLTIAACGSYSVQCQACTTLNGVLTCDPVWTGATP